MRELFAMWGNTRMVVLTAISAALYAAILIPFKRAPLIAATLCATVVGWGLQALGFHPFTVLGTLVLMNNLVVALVLAPFLLTVLYPRIRHARLLYRDLLGPRPAQPRWRTALGVALVVAGTGAAFTAGGLSAGGGRLAPRGPSPTGARPAGVGLRPRPLA